MQVQSLAVRKGGLPPLKLPERAHYCLEDVSKVKSTSIVAPERTVIWIVFSPKRSCHATNV